MTQPQPENNNNDNAAIFAALRATQIAALTRAQEIALQLYSIGLNVFPQPYGSKSGYPWRGLQFARLNPDSLLLLFDGHCNVAVMCGRTSDNLFVIDCETEDAYHQQYRALKNADIPIWAVRTNGSGNGGHFYLRCKDGEVKGIRPGERPGYEVRGNRCYVLAPPSMHPKTLALYQWSEQETLRPPIVTLDQLPWLKLELTHSKRQIASTSPLSQKTRSFIANGAVEGERNNRLFEAACDLAGNQFDQHATTQLLLPIAERCGLPTEEARSTLASAFSKPRTPSKPDNKTQHHIHHKVSVWAEARRWSGRTGQTDRAVMLACCERAVTANERGVFRVSSRELAEIARMTRKTASKALKRLCDQKLLTYCGRDKLSGAGLYCFGFEVKREIRESTPLPNPPLVRISGVISPKSDAVERRALGKTAYLLYKVMLTLNSPSRGKELAETAHLTVNQVYGALGKLKRYGLVEKVKGGFTVVAKSDEQLDDEVARPAGVLGKPQERREAHDEERGKRATLAVYKARGIEWYKEEKQEKQEKEQKGKRKKEEKQEKGWLCPYCGQVWFIPGMEPPDVCDFCLTMTTWQKLD